MDEYLKMYVYPGARRRIQVKYFSKPVGYVRQNWGTRWRSDRLGDRVNVYNGYKALLRDLMAISMKSQDIEMLPKVPLRVDSTFCFATEREMMQVDIDNLLKGVLDSCKGILIPDDRWVVKAESFKKWSENGAEIVIFNIGEL